MNRPGFRPCVVLSSCLFSLGGRGTTGEEVDPDVEFSPRYTPATGELPAFLTSDDRSLADISADTSGLLGN